MKKLLLTILLGSLSIIHGCSQVRSGSDRVVGGGCDNCDMMYEGMPTTLANSTSLSKPGEPGVPMIISGTIYQKDGRTPAAGVILYVYHTDNNGYYSAEPGQKHGIRNGHLRGWIKTDNSGKYEFKSIRPAPYPKETAPAHIHPLIKEPGLTRYWIDEYLFDDDPLLTEKERSRQEKRGGSGIIHLTKNENGVWIGHRDIILGMNIPNY